MAQTFLVLKMRILESMFSLIWLFSTTGQVLGLLLCMLLLMICWGDAWLESCGGDKEGCVGHLLPTAPLQVMMIGAYHVVINSLTDLLSHVGTELCNKCLDDAVWFCQFVLKLVYVNQILGVKEGLWSAMIRTCGVPTKLFWNLQSPKSIAVSSRSSCGYLLSAFEVVLEALTTGLAESRSSPWANIAPKPILWASVIMKIFFLMS